MLMLTDDLIKKKHLFLRFLTIYCYIYLLKMCILQYLDL
jgi:hypothetical protein